MSIAVKCEICGKEEIVPPSRAKRYRTCSKKCMGIYLKSIPNIPCYICGKLINIKPYRLKGSVTKEFCCSKECDREHRKILMTGERNHQYGLKGSKNSSFKSNTRINVHGYELTYSPNHPFRDCDDKVRTHRLVAEDHLLTSDNSIEINGIRYLKPELEVHHVDEDKLNNNYNNLMVLTKSEHMSIHSKKRSIQKRLLTNSLLPMINYAHQSQLMVNQGGIQC